MPSASYLGLDGTWIWEEETHCNGDKAKCERVWKCAGGVVDDMELSRLERSIPSRNAIAISLSQLALIKNQCERIEESQHGAYNELRPLLSHDGNDRFADCCKSGGTNKCALYGAWKLKVVIVGIDCVSVLQDVVCGLEVEALLDLCVGDNVEMPEDQRWDGQLEGSICSKYKFLRFN